MTQTRNVTQAEFNPWFMEAYNICKFNQDLKIDWGRFLDAARKEHGVDRLSHVQTNQACYRWLARIGYQNLKTIE
jgi:hypothetical protein